MLMRAITPLIGERVKSTSISNCSKREPAMISSYPKTERVWIPMSVTLLPVFQGLATRKNRLPVGDVMVMLFVPFAVLMV